MDLKSLREHILYLCERADEHSMIAAARLLEGGGDRNLSTFSLSESANRDSISLGPPSNESRERFRSASANDDADCDSVPALGFDPSLGAGGASTILLHKDGTDPLSAGEDRPPPAGQFDDGEQSVRGRRIAVSAAPVIMNQVRDFVPRVIPKTDEELDMLKAAVSDVHLFTGLDEEEQITITKALERIEFEPGRMILTQGQPPDPPQFYILTEGLCEVVKNGQNVASLTQGSTFGELEIMHDNTVCAATIRCVKKSVMYALDQETYRNIVLQVTIAKRERYTALLKSVSFLEDVPDYEKTTLSEALTPEKFEPGDYIIRFGDKGKYMYIIEEGEVQVVGREMGKKVDVIKLGPGNPLGELEFLFGHLCIADVVAIDKVKTVKISKRHFDSLPISNQLKQWVAKKGNYKHYLNTAGDDVKKEISNIEKQTKKRVLENGQGLENVDENGEIILVDPEKDGKGDHKLAVHRFPLKPFNRSNLVMIGLREDKTIVTWNDAAARVTNFAAAEVIGTPFEAYLVDDASREALYDGILTAKKWIGNTDGFFADAESSADRKFVFARSDGLTRTMISLCVIPPAFAQRGVRDVFLAIGVEVRAPPPAVSVDHAGWLSTQVQEHLSNSLIAADEKLRLIDVDVKKFESMKNSGHVSAENLRAVDIHKLINSVVTDYLNKAVEKGHNMTVLWSEELKVANIEIFCDTVLLPECLRYALSNCVNHLSNAQIEITIQTLDLMGGEYLEIRFHDDGPGISKKVLDAFHSIGGPISSMKRVKHALQEQGGRMLIESRPGSTDVVFQVPFLSQEKEDEDRIAPDLTMARSQSGAFMNDKKKRNFTTLIVEEASVHRNAMCAHLWDRKHAVLPGNGWADIQRLSDVADILILDVQQSILAEDLQTVRDPFAYLQTLSRTMAIVITSTNMDEDTIRAYNSAGYFTLKKPVTPMTCVAVLRKAEEKAGALKAEMEKVAQVRETFNKTSRGEWRKGALLGKGAFGEVFEAIDVLTGGKMAVKMMRVTKNMDKNELLNEIEVMCTLQHPNIIHYFYCEDAKDAADQDQINVFMEYAAGGTLQGLLQKTGKLEHKEYVRFMRDIVEGVKYIHDQRYVHCDLKTANVLLSLDQKGKIGDFGTAKRLQGPNDLEYVMRGTPMYMSPECMEADPERKIGYSFPADIWSVGCIALEMATNKPPFHWVQTNGAMGLIKYVTEDIEDQPDLSCLFDCAPSIFEFVAACLQKDPSKRPTAAQLLEMNLFREGDNDMKSANKALQRAQLLHILNKFVAFQDEAELEAQRREKEKLTKRRDSDFFDSDSDDGGEANFFNSDDDEEEAEDEDGSSKTVSQAVSTPAAPTPPLGERDSGMKSPVLGAPAGAKRGLLSVGTVQKSDVGDRSSTDFPEGAAPTPQLSSTALLRSVTPAPPPAPTAADGVIDFFSGDLFGGGDFFGAGGAGASALTGADARHPTVEVSSPLTPTAKPSLAANKQLEQTNTIEQAGTALSIDSVGSDTEETGGLNFFGVAPMSTEPDETVYPVRNADETGPATVVGKTTQFVPKPPSQPVPAAVTPRFVNSSPSTTALDAAKSGLSPPSGSVDPQSVIALHELLMAVIAPRGADTMPLASTAAPSGGATFVDPLARQYAQFLERTKLDTGAGGEEGSTHDSVGGRQHVRRVSQAFVPDVAQLLRDDIAAVKALLRDRQQLQQQA